MLFPLGLVVDFFYWISWYLKCTDVFGKNYMIHVILSGNNFTGTNIQLNFKFRCNLGWINNDHYFTVLSTSVVIFHTYYDWLIDMLSLLHIAQTNVFVKTHPKNSNFFNEILNHYKFPPISTDWPPFFFLSPLYKF